MIPVADRALVAAAIDAVVPGDDFPSATQAGVLDDLDRCAETDHAVLWQRILTPGFAHLAADVASRGRLDLDAVAASSGTGEWSVVSALFVATLERLVAESYYGRRGCPRRGRRAGPAGRAG